jgi:hypothetical protein
MKTLKKINNSKYKFKRLAILQNPYQCNSIKIKTLTIIKKNLS